MSKEINLPPFYVGQRVVCIDDSRDDGFESPIKKGCVYVVLANKPCSCGIWSVDIGIKYTGGSRCYCGLLSKDDCWWLYAKRFAPIHENFKSISLEKVLEEETKLISVN